MKYQIFLILAIISLTFSQSSQPILDTYNFDEQWRIPNTPSVSLEWSYNSGSQSFDFDLSFKKNSISTIKNFVFLMERRSANSFISDFQPSIDTSGASRDHWKQNILVADFDDKSGNNKFPCPRVADGPKHEMQTCFGFFAFAHEIELVPTNSRTNREQMFHAGLNLALLRWEFELKIRYNLEVQSEVETKVKTKVREIPCQDCSCANECHLSVGFKLSHIICKAENDCDKDDQRANNFEFGETAILKFYLDVKTRNLIFHELHASSASDGLGATLDKAKFITDLDTQTLGEYKLSLPIAGPASENGLWFNLKFTFRLSSKVGAARFLEEIPRLDQQTATPDVVVSDIKGFQVQDNKTQLETSESMSLDRVYKFCIAMIALVCLTCLCATFSNLKSIFSKKQVESPTQAAKA